MKGDGVLSDSLNHRFTESYRLFLPRPSPLPPLPQGGEGNKPTNPSPYSLFYSVGNADAFPTLGLVIGKIPKQVRDDSNTGEPVTWFEKVLEILRPRVF